MEVLEHKIDKLIQTVEKLDTKVDIIQDSVTRHDERISAMQNRNNWISGIFAAFISFLLKDKLPWGP